MSLEKAGLINELLLCQLPKPFTINPSEETDLIVQFDNSKEIMLGNSLISKLKDYYYGYILFDTKLRKAYYHEELINKGKGIDPYNTSRSIFFGCFKYKTYNFDGFEADEEINYPMVRNILDLTLRKHGWTFELVITKNEAIYKRFTTPRSIILLKKYSFPSVAVLIPLIAISLLIYQLQDPTDRENLFKLIIIAIAIYPIKLLRNKIIEKFKGIKKQE